MLYAITRKIENIGYEKRGVDRRAQDLKMGMLVQSRNRAEAGTQPIIVH
jgi:hypothetical protein